MSRINTVKLHKLILSLKKEEKRFFKLFTKNQNYKEDSYYLKIFDYLDKVEEVDRTAFKKQFENVKGLSGMQSYLYKLILRSLRNQPAYQDVENVLREGLADLTILYKKELLVEVQEKLQELFHLAQLHDKIFYLPLLYEWWFTLENAYFHYLRVEPALLVQQIAAYKQSIEELEAFHLYRTELGKLLILLQEDPKEIHQDLTQLAAALPAYNTNQQEHGLSVRVQELQFRRTLAISLGNTQGAYFYGAELSSMLKELPKEVFPIYEGFYYRALLGQIAHAPSPSKYKELMKEIEQRLQSKAVKKVDKHILMTIFLNKIDFALSTGDFETFEELLQKNANHLEFLLDSGTEYLQKFWYLRWMLYHFAIQQYTQALTIYQEQLLAKEVSILLKKPSLYLEMILYYEQGEYLLLDSILKNNTRFLRKNKALLHPEKKIITLLTKLIKLPPTAHQAAFVTAKEEMIQDLAMLGEAQKEFLTYFNYIGWIDSKITGQPFQQLFFRHTGVIDLG